MTRLAARFPHAPNPRQTPGEVSRTHAPPRGVRFAANPPRPTWDALVAAEPRLADLLAEARRERPDDDGRCCANEAWFGWRGRPGIKPRLVRLVGWHAESSDPALGTVDAYDLAYKTIYAALPDCAGCGCPGVEP